jgi:hypothetical protein
VREEAEGPLEAILVLTTLGAPERRRWRDRRGREVEEAEPALVPTTRVTVVRPAPFESRMEGEAWLQQLRSSGADAELERALGVLNRSLHSWRTSAADPYAGDVTAERTLVIRMGFGDGEAVADGRFADAWELPPRAATRTRRSMEAPEERFAALLGARERVGAAEELVLRARADLDAGRPREAALQARVALEALLAELESPRSDGLEAERPVVARAANLALGDELTADALASLAAAIEQMETALRRVRLGG